MRFPKRPFRLALLLAGLLLVVACGYDSYFLLQSTPDARPLWTGIPHNPGYTATPVPATDTPTWQATATAHPAGQAGEWFAFNLPWDDASLNWVDASDLTGGGSGLAGLVDRRGFVTMDDSGHFIFSNTGERARFWGVNLTYGAALPPCPDAPPGEGDLFLT